MFPTIVNNPLTNLSANLPPALTTATLSQYYSQISTSWEIGTQQATLDGSPYSRVYSLLSFPTTSNNALTKVDLPQYDPTYGGTFYYQVASYFTETQYSSNIYSTQELPFSQWCENSSQFRAEAVYAHKQVSQLVWTRPSTSTEGTDGGTPTVTYDPLPANYSISTNVGTALGAIITSDGSFQVTLKSSSMDTGTIVDPSFILLTEPILYIEFTNITDILPTTLTITFYGSFLWTTVTPISTNSNQLTLVHPITATPTERLKPPGLSTLPDNFWNSTPETTTDFSTRTNAPAWLS